MSVAYKALTFPLNELQSSNNVEKTRANTIIRSDSEHLLLFLCKTDILDQDVIFQQTAPNVFLYLHVLSTGATCEFSMPYRLLRIEKTAFVNDIINRRKCVIPQKYFIGSCVRDYFKDVLTLRVEKKLKVSHNIVNSVSDFNSFFHTLYRNVDYKPNKMFTLAHYFFKYGENNTFFVVSEIYEKYYNTVECTDPNENYHLIQYMKRKCQTTTVSELDNQVCEFNTLVELFKTRSLDTYAELNQLSQRYSHEETGGIVCSFAMTKAFQSMKPQDFVKIDNAKEHREMIQLYTETIKYYDKNQFEDLNKDVYENVKSLSISASRLSRYILKQESEPLFGLKMKQSDFKILLSNALLDYYGLIPPPYIDMHPTRILCEMMSGVYDKSDNFAATVIMKLRPFKPILTKWKNRHHEILTLNALTIDRSFPNSVLRLISKHIKEQTINSFMNYCRELEYYIKQYDYFYHEIVNPYLPIFTINADIDIYDKTYSRSYYEDTNQWELKEQLFNSLRMLVIYVCETVMKLPVTKDNTVFYMYESVRDDLAMMNNSKFKLGIRLIIKFSTICFMNREVVDKFLKILNIFRYRYDVLRQIQDDNIFDTAIYGQLNHGIRLPLNMKCDGKKALIPVFFKYHEKNYRYALFMTQSFVHSRNNLDNEASITCVYDSALPTEEMIITFGTEGVLKQMYIAKSNKREPITGGDTAKTSALSKVKFTKEQRDALIDAIDRYSMGRLKQRSNRKILDMLKNRPLVYQHTNKFRWCSGLKFCAITEHNKPLGNPCDYYVRLNSTMDKRLNKRECSIYCKCFSPLCYEKTRKHCIWKCFV